MSANLLRITCIVFVFIAGVASLGVMVADHFLNVASDPRLIAVLTSLLGFSLSQLGVSQASSQLSDAVSGLNVVPSANVIATKPVVAGPDEAPLA